MDILCLNFVLLNLVDIHNTILSEKLVSGVLNESQLWFIDYY